MIELIRFIGERTLFVVESLGKTALFMATAIFWMFVPPFKIRRAVKQINFIGVNSTFIVLLTGLFTGMVLGLQGYYALRKFGADTLLGPTVALSLIRELGPVISALMITARAGSALAAEIGIMRISEQIDALEIMALNPYRYLIVPNLVAGVIAFPILSSFFDLVGIFGGYLIGVNLLGINSSAYFGEMKTYVEMKDIIGGLYKSLCFGVIVTWICNYKGFHAGYGAEGVSRATTQAVVLCSVLILISDYFVTSIYF